MKNLIHLILFFFFATGLQAQEIIPFINGSFEGEPSGHAATIPQAWLPCRMGTTPDILPGAWGVYTIPSHGHTYLGLITRDDGSYESIGQHLSQTLKAGNCYSFTMDLAHSGTYSGYNLPIRVRVWGGRRACAKDQLLWESQLIHNARWETHKIEFLCKKDIRYIIIEAYFAPGVFIKYRGNVLIDHLTGIKQCNRA